jgi:DNA polymerase III subunit delta'
VSDTAAPLTPPAVPGAEGPTDPLAGLSGQEAAVTQLRAALAAPVHAYLFVGPPGTGKRAAARAFAAALLSDGADRAGDAVAAARHRALALAERHPDLVVVEREGPYITRDQARSVVVRAARTPVEGDRTIVVLTEFHLVTDAAPILLKSIEEPPPSTIFVILADEVPPELVTVASRCAVVRFSPWSLEQVVARLVADGVAPELADVAGASAGGDLARARAIAADPARQARARCWAEVPDRLDGTGAAVAAAVVDLLATLDEALVDVDERHRRELGEAAERDERYGLRSTRRTLEDRHRRERRRVRSAELRFGLAVLGRRLRDEVVASPGRAGLDALDAVQQAAEALERNPNEKLLLERLLIRVRPLRDH